MFTSCMRVVSRRVADQLARGDTSLLSRFVAEDVKFRFPGQHPFAVETTSRDDLIQWWVRFAHFRPKFQIHDVLVSGPPWNVRAALFFTDQIGDPDDGTPYTNEGVCLFRIRWGKVVEERVFLDTQAVADFFGTETAEEFFPENMVWQH